LTDEHKTISEAETMRPGHFSARTVLVTIGVVGAALCLAAGVSLAASAGRGENAAAGPASGHGGPSAKAIVAKHLAEARAAGAPEKDALEKKLTYPPEGITLSAPHIAAGRHMAAVAADPSAVLASLAEQTVPKNVLGSLLTGETPSVAEQTITEGDPVSPDVIAGTPYQGWVVTYSNVPAQSYGPQTITGTCDFTAIMDSATGVWTDFFQNC
jgi:hypothetical protein